MTSQYSAMSLASACAVAGQPDLALTIEAVELEDVLGEIQPYRASMGS